jgi:hypothetical protein
MDSLVSDEPEDFRGTIVKDYRRLNEKQPIPGGYGFQDATAHNNIVLKIYGTF